MKTNIKDKKLIKGLKREIRHQQQDEIQFILQQTELPIIQKFSDNKIDRNDEIFKLGNGFETSINRLVEVQKNYKKFLRNKIKNHEKTFPDEIYKHWRRLRGWDNKPYKKHHKPLVFARYTKLYIYGRFPREILPEIEKRNYYYPGTYVRLNRHFQHLTNRAYISLKSYIQDVVKVAESCHTMYEFQFKYAVLYGNPFQLSLFENNDIKV